LPDFSRRIEPKREKFTKMATKIPNGHEMCTSKSHEMPNGHEIQQNVLPQDLPKIPKWHQNKMA
jgi:hypothetical protein